MSGSSFLFCLGIFLVRMLNVLVAPNIDNCSRFLRLRGWSYLVIPGSKSEVLVAFKDGLELFSSFLPYCFLNYKS